MTTAALVDGAELRIGTTELVFRLRTKAPSVEPTDEGAPGALVRCGPVAQLEGSVLRRASAGATDDARRPLLLYQASIRLLASRSIREVIGATLELAAEHCGAKGVGWFRVFDEHRLEPVCVVPPGSPLVRLLGESTRRLVAGAGNAVWASGSAGSAQGPEPGDEHEVVCIPIIDGDRVHAALAALTAKGGMRPADFDFLVALASLSAAAYDGHADPAVVPMPPLTPPESRPAESCLDDLAARQTVDLDPTVLDDDGKTIGLDEVDMVSLDPRGTDGPAGAAAEESLRIESFVAETPMLKLDHWQRMLVIEALRRAGGSVPGAAAELGISRSSLHRQLARYGLVKSDPR